MNDDPNSLSPSLAELMHASFDASYVQLPDNLMRELYEFEVREDSYDDFCFRLRELITRYITRLGRLKEMMTRQKHDKLLALKKSLEKSLRLVRELPKELRQALDVNLMLDRLLDVMRERDLGYEVSVPRPGTDVFEGQLDTMTSGVAKVIEERPVPKGRPTTNEPIIELILDLGAFLKFGPPFQKENPCYFDAALGEYQGPLVTFMERMFAHLEVQGPHSNGALGKAIQRAFDQEYKAQT